MEDERTRQWRRRFPCGVLTILCLLQVIFSFAVIGCEVGSMIVDFYRMNAFVGYWAFPFFMCAWISLAGAGCCCRTSCCITAALVFQCLAIPVSIGVIGLDGYFLNHPLQCFFSDYCSYYSYYGYDYYSNSTTNRNPSPSSDFYSIKLPLVKAQLAAGVLMLVSCIVFIIIYIIANVLMRKGPKTGQPMAQPYVAHNQPYAGAPVPVQTVVTVPPPVQVVPHPTQAAPQGKSMTCPHCRTVFPIAF